ncbi:TRAP transporter permease [Pelagibius litoralis]|uniref:TRAP transporter permease n=1 Tax=Pelagibius litoralis TaxID=374515 RepID=A0A967KDF8_9PROT|nr:TRAP transporter permease [Pelagibius litoralis]NIA70200.1 TRAP transporter permease [Pelagibius litoralis]
MADDSNSGRPTAAQGGTTGAPVSDDDLQDLVASSDTGGRSPTGIPLYVILWTAALWSLFQIWIASPLPFVVAEVTGLPVVLNNTESRAIHLGFAVFLAFLAYPAMKRSPRAHIPAQDWVLALVGAFCSSYLFWFYDSISLRPANPNTMDLVVACIGMAILLEATRRALGPPLTVIASLFLIYTFFGQYMPDLIAHKGVSLAGVVNHQWITTEGVFGVALGVSTDFVFLFVLFGALLDKAGAGNYFIKVAFSLLGHYRGGPAKAAVVASAMTGLISGSSIANVVTTGTFTIPMMKRVGFSPEKAGAVEVASSVNGQIMPPVMGAAAFLMVEYVGITYFEVVKHAFVPALISYIALVYIVHLEAMKADMKGLPRASAPTPLMKFLIMTAFGIAVVCGLALATYYGLGWIKTLFGDAAGWVIAGLLSVVYIGIVRFCSIYPDLELDDPNAPIVSLPKVGPTVKSGIHFILPVIVLIWCLMVERLSPGLSAFWATAFMIFIVLTQRPLFAVFRGRSELGSMVTLGTTELGEGLVAGARNMIGIGIATATAGVIVGSVSQTGVGLVLAELVEILSFGNILLILLWTAILSLILGMGLPTTANYIVVSALLAPVIVQLGQDAGLIVPLIAVHLFVFYFGIMADVTPPVGLASFAAAAVSGGDPIKTGFVAFFYSLRTAALPFLFIFNTDLLLINVGWVGGIVVFIVATAAMLIFAAATQGFFLARNRAYETVLLLLIAFTLFRPGFWMDMVSPPTQDVSPTQIMEVADRMQPGETLRIRVDGVDAVGDLRSFVALLPLGEGATGEERLQAAGLELLIDGDQVLVDNAVFDSPAEAAGLEFDQVIVTVSEPVDQLPKELMYIPALLVLGLIIVMQRGRQRRQPAAAVA